MVVCESLVDVIVVRDGEAEEVFVEAKAVAEVTRVQSKQIDVALGIGFAALSIFPLALCSMLDTELTGEALWTPDAVVGCVSTLGPWVSSAVETWET